MQRSPVRNNEDFPANFCSTKWRNIAQRLTWHSGLSNPQFVVPTGISSSQSSFQGWPLIESELQWLALKHCDRDESHFLECFGAIELTFSQLQEPFCCRRMVRKRPFSCLLYINYGYCSFRFLHNIFQLVKLALSFKLGFIGSHGLVSCDLLVEIPCAASEKAKTTFFRPFLSYIRTDATVCSVHNNSKRHAFIHWDWLAYLYISSHDSWIWFLFLCELYICYDVINYFFNWYSGGWSPVGSTRHCGH
jgi:hypothetical protein